MFLGAPPVITPDVAAKWDRLKTSCDHVEHSMLLGPAMLGAAAGVIFAKDHDVTHRALKGAAYGVGFGFAVKLLMGGLCESARSKAAAIGLKG